MEMRSEVFTRASTSRASPGDSSGGVRLWGCPLLYLCGDCPGASWLTLPQPHGCPAFAWSEGGAQRWTLAGI